MIAAVCMAGALHAQRTRSSLSAGEQRSAEKGLKDNRYFFYFIDSSISNGGTDEEKKIFREAVQRDIIAQLLYMKFLFSDSFQEIRKSQELLISLYRTSLKRDINDTTMILNRFAQNVIKSDTASARNYLRLGYREMSSGRIRLGMADNYRESLYSMRLYEYVAAIKKVHQGKRFAFFSILESTLPVGEASEFGYMNYKELHRAVGERAAAASGIVPPDEGAGLIARLNRLDGLNRKRLYYERRKRNEKAGEIAAEIEGLKKEIREIDEGLALKYGEYKEKKELYMLFHADSYYRTPEDKTLFDTIWEDPRLQEIKDFGEYLKKQ